MLQRLQQSSPSTSLFGGTALPTAPSPIILRSLNNVLIQAKKVWGSNWFCFHRRSLTTECLKKETSWIHHKSKETKNNNAQLAEENLKCTVWVLNCYRRATSGMFLFRKIMHLIMRCVSQKNSTPFLLTARLTVTNFER